MSSVKSEPVSGGPVPRKIGRPAKLVRSTYHCLSVHGTKQWRDWVMGLAQAERMPACVLVDLALNHYARSKGLREAPARVK